MAGRRRQTAQDRGNGGFADDDEQGLLVDLADLDRNIKLHPADAYAISSRGQMYLAMKRYDEALADLDRAIELDASDAWAISARGQAHG